GIAKILKPDIAGDETRTQAFALTPEYASPEQIRGENLSTATDIYSLGVVLYELLTSSRPFRFDGKNIGEIIETVTRSEPKPPSFAREGEKRRKGESENIPNDKISLSPFLPFSPSQIKGDLDNIILKALKKEPERRYSSVEQFAEDIRRHLKGLPVFARQDTWRYRAEKFTRRNPLVVGTVALAFLILIGGILATAFQARKANIEREKAERRFNDVRALANSFMFEINEEITKSPIKARELLVQRALEYLDKLAAESEGNVELKSELAAAYEKIGEVQSEIFRPFSGKTSEAILSQQKALKLREEIFAAEPSATHVVDVAISRMNIGNVFITSGNLGEARENFREAIRILESQIVFDSKNIEWRRRLAQSLAMLGQTIVRSGSLGEALENYEKSLKIYQNVADENPENLRFQRSVGIVLSYIGFVKMEMGKTGEAAEYYEKWLNIQKKLIEKDGNNVQFRNDLSTAHIWFGVILSEQRKLAQAQENFNEGVRIQTEILADDKENLGEEYALADCYLEFGKAMVRNNLADDAVKNLEKAIGHYRRIWQKDAQNLMNRHRIANSQRFLADAFFQKNNFASASENYDQAHLVFKELTDSDPQNIDWQQDLAMSFMRRGEFALKKNDKASALENFRQALPIFEKLATNSPENIKRQNDLENIRNLLAQR
ncbi:MAG TPA: protein kinase, partial [Pyrinomonadaceae bacterium]|nr:protein kinase [Pyrinomonadaceae bacterium]